VATALIVEDGTGLSNSNTYASVDDAVAYASAMGATLPNSDNGVQITAWLLTAMVYIERYKFIGQQLNPAYWQHAAVTAGQALQWPRTDPQQAVIEQYAPGALMPWMMQLATIPPGVPTAVKKAQCQLVVEQANGIALFKSQQGGQGLVTSERFDVLSTTYDVRGTSKTPWMPIVDELLDPLIVPGSKCLVKSVRR
jgi:hypothetical protein